MKTYQRNCIEIVTPLISELNGRGLLDNFQLMGGIGSAVLKHLGTEILPEEQLIVASPDFCEGNVDLCPTRPNGTMRDLDALVLSDDPDYVAEVEAVTEDFVGGALEVSVFGLRKAAYLQRQKERPFGMVSLKAWLSDRYMEDDGTMLKALTPFAVTLPVESMESWTAKIGDNYYPVMNPGVSLLNYATRSISGLRPKDADKVEAMAAHVGTKWPGVKEWIHDGPGESQAELANIFHTLRWGREGNRRSIGGVIDLVATTVPALRDNEAFMFKDADERTQRRVLQLAVGKARLLGTTESNPTIVMLFQKFAEKHLDTVTKNQ